MAKEIIPPNPIPVGEDPITNGNIFHCATMIDSGDQYHENRGPRSELISNILDYLGSHGTLWETSDEFWNAYVLDADSVEEATKQLCKNVDGLTPENIGEYVQIIDAPYQLTAVVFLV